MVSLDLLINYDQRTTELKETKGDKAKFDVRSLRLGRLYDDPCYDSDEDNDGVMKELTKIFTVKKLK